jgi:hypothetical protein
MDTLQELLESLNVEGMSRDELAELDAEISAAAEELAADDTLTEDGLALLEQAGEAVQAIREADEALETKAEEDRARAAAVLEAIRGPQDEETEDVEDEVDEIEAEADEPETDDVVEEIEADVEIVAEDDVVVEDGELEPVLADAKPRRAPLTKVAARRPEQPAPMAVKAPDLAELGLVAAANAPGVQVGQPVETYDDLAKAFISAYESTKGYQHGPPVKVPIVRSGKGDFQYPESHRLDANMSSNMDKIAKAQAAVQAEGGMRSAVEHGLTASGGICAPEEVRYDMPTLGVDDRPVRDGFMTRFGADRGGITTLPPPVLEEVAGAVDVWTNANDITPSDPTTKPCLTVTCPSEDNSVVEAITKCLEYGNFRARYLPEQIEAWMDLAAVQHARTAEVQLLTAIAAGSTAVTAGQVLGTTRDVLASLDRANAVWRYRHRDDGITLSFAAPAWLRDQIKADIARQLPVGSTDETLAVADANIDRWFASRNIDPVWLLDGTAGQTFGVQGAGPLQGWPSTVTTYLAPAGSWLFLDGGMLDLGIVRDSTLNSTNDVQVFAETFEGSHFHGVESWTLTFDTCPDGSTSAAVDIAPCVSGS